VTMGHKMDIIIIIIPALNPVLQVWIQYNVYHIYIYMYFCSLLLQVSIGFTELITQQYTNLLSNSIC